MTNLAAWLANTSAAATLLPGELIAFLAAHPDIDIDLEERPSHSHRAGRGRKGRDVGLDLATGKMYYRSRDHKR